MIVNALFTFVVLATSTYAQVPAWHLDTLGLLVNERLDPIVDVNNVGGHMHEIVGGSNFGASYNYKTLASSSCTTSAITADKSNYWVPKLYWVSNGGKNFTALPAFHRFYYFLARQMPNTPLDPFPEGLRMLVGDPNAKSATWKPSQFRFTCHINSDLYSGDIVSDNFNFGRDCPYGIRLEIRFPSCWDGKNLYKSDQSHMDWPVNNAEDLRAGQCTYSHPIKVPAITLEYTFAPSKVAPGQKVAGNLAWSNGDTTGYGAHADFTNGWNTAVLAAALKDNTCAGTNARAMTIQSCPVLSPYYNTGAAAACKPALGVMVEPGQKSNDDLTSISALPGCNKLWSSGSKPTCSPAPSNPDPSKFKGTDGSLIPTNPLVTPNTPNKWNEMFCSLDLGPTGINLVNPKVYQDTKLTRTGCTNMCAQNGYQYAALSYRNSRWECVCGTGILPNAANAVGMCTSNCPGNSAEKCGGTNVHQILYNPSAAPKLGTNGYYGCLPTPSNRNSGLEGKALYKYSSSSMTNDACISTCKSKNYAWALTQGGGQCMCGNDVQLGGMMFYPDSFCTKPCSGNSGEKCGDLYADSVFSLNGKMLVTMQKRDLEARRVVDSRARRVKVDERDVEDEVME